jgi:hypothetical protein
VQAVAAWKMVADFIDPLIRLKALFYFGLLLPGFFFQFVRNYLI